MSCQTIQISLRSILHVPYNRVNPVRLSSAEMLGVIYSFRTHQELSGLNNLSLTHISDLSALRSVLELVGVKFVHLSLHDTNEHSPGLSSPHLSVP